MDTESIPIANGCYIDLAGNMFKVRMVSYNGSIANRIVLENTQGDMITVNFAKWQRLQLIPCCQSSNELHEKPITSL